MYETNETWISLSIKTMLRSAPTNMTLSLTLGWPWRATKVRPSLIQRKLEPTTWSSSTKSFTTCDTRLQLWKKVWKVYFLILKTTWAQPWRYSRSRGITRRTHNYWCPWTTARPSLKPISEKSYPVGGKESAQRRVKLPKKDLLVFWQNKFASILAQSHSETHSRRGITMMNSVNLRAWCRRPAH